MAFNHENRITYRYTAGGSSETKEIVITETEEAEINLSYTVAMGSTVTAALVVPGFEFADSTKAVSVYFRLDGVNGKILGDGAGHSAGGTLMANLDDGVPFVWSKNGGVNFPAGATNPMTSTAATALNITPDAHHAVTNPLAIDGNSVTLTVKVLYDPSP